MNLSHYDVLICASVLPATGMNTNLFLNCLPIDDVPTTVAPLLKEDILTLGRFKIALHPDYTKAIDLSEHESPSVILAFLRRLLEEMAACSNIEDNRNFLSVLHTFQNACKQFCGRNEGLDEQLAELLASLVNLIDVPMIHFVKRDMDFDAYDRSHLDVLCSAEASLALKTLDRGLDEEDDSFRKLGLYRFTRDSLQAVSVLLHGPLSPDEATDAVDELLKVVEKKVSEWEAVVEIEAALLELEKECGRLPGNH